MHDTSYNKNILWKLNISRKETSQVDYFILNWAALKTPQKQQINARAKWNKQSIA